MQLAIVNLVLEISATQNQKLLFVLVNSLVGTVLALELTPNLVLFKSLIAITTLLITFKYILNINLTKSLFSLMLIVAISFPAETLTGLINNKLLNLSADSTEIIKSLPRMIIANIIISVLAYIVLIIKKNNCFFYFKDVKNKNIYISLFMTIAFILPNILFYTKNNYNYPLYLLVYNILANIALILVGIYNTYNCVQLQTKKRDLENAQLYNNQLLTLIDSIRTFKHDYNNVVQSIGGYVTLKDIEGLSNYYKGLLRDCQKVNQIEYISPLIINEPSIYGIIASKCQIAELKGIEFNIESLLDYKKLGMDIYNFCKILGILLDNAIEAAEETSNKMVKMTVRENVRKNMQSITIENTYKNKTIDINKIYEKGFSTKNRNSGIGLWEVKNIVSKAPNVNLKTTKDEHYFKQQLTISTSPIQKNFLNKVNQG
jgi:two-component system sensor histidine kinase AgrC